MRSGLIFYHQEAPKKLVYTPVCNSRYILEQTMNGGALDRSSFGRYSFKLDM